MAPICRYNRGIQCGKIVVFASCALSCFLETLSDLMEQRVFDLWLGTIESYDGALQLILILDFIWTWARDIYRPAIRRCLREGSDSVRGHSPTSTDAFARSESLPSQRSFPPSIPGSTLTHRPEFNMSGAGHASARGEFTIDDVVSHPLRQWNKSPDLVANWASQTIIRPSDIVSCSFRFLELPDKEESFDSLTRPLKDGSKRKQTLSHLLPLIQQAQYSVPLARKDISTIERGWMGTNMADSKINRSKPHEVLMSFFFFRTFIQRQDWEIKRELYCIAWSIETAEILRKLTDPGLALDYLTYWSSSRVHDVIEATLHVRNVSGKKSVEWAFTDTNLVLCQHEEQSAPNNRLQWTRPPSQGVSGAVLLRYRNLFQAASSGIPPFSELHYRSDRLLWLRRQDHAAEAKEGAILAGKSYQWPEQCPKFCLFVLEGGEIDTSYLGRLLQGAIGNATYDMNSTNGALTFNEKDKNILRSWFRSFGLTT